jgi:hypothetical protein
MDTVGMALEMDMRMSKIPAEAHCRALLQAVPKARRWSKWPKRAVPEAAKAVALVYGLPLRTAMGQLHMFNAAELDAVVDLAAKAGAVERQKIQKTKKGK